MAFAKGSWVVLVFLFCSNGVVLPDPIPADRYTVDLDLPPEERWTNITKKYAQYMPEMLAALGEEIPKDIRPFAEEFALFLDKHYPEPYPGEMRSIAKGMNITLADVVLLNIFYDLSAFCTGIVVQREGDGGIIHGRNFDYAHTDLLRNLTFIADFKSKGTTLKRRNFNYPEQNTQ